MDIIFEDGTKEGLEHQIELNNLMKHISEEVNQIGKDNLGMFRTAKSLKKYQFDSFVFSLIHTICNCSEEYLYTKIKREDFHLPFPLLIQQDKSETSWKLVMDDVEFIFFKENTGAGYSKNYVNTNRYFVSQLGKTDAYAEVMDEELRNNKPKEIRSEIIEKLSGYCANLYRTRLFYDLVFYVEQDIIDKDSPAIEELIDVLQDNHELLKIIAFVSDGKMQEDIIAKVLRANIKIDMDEPSILLKKVYRQLVAWENTHDVSPTEYENLKNDVESNIEKLKDKNLPLYKHLLVAKLDNSLAKHEIHKKAKI